MPFFIITLTESQRYRLGVTFTSLIAAKMFCGFLLLGYVGYVSYIVTPNLFSEYREINYVLVILTLNGIHIVFIYGVGLRIAYKSYYQSAKRSTPRLLILWYFAAANSMFDLLVITHATRKEIANIVISIKISMEKGISSYLIDENWKLIMDQIQYTYKCCGVDGYLDWHDITWVTKYQISASSDLVKQLRTSHDIFALPITPWSCCNLDFPMQCLHDPFQQTQSTYLWVDQPDLVLDSLNTRGCLDLLRVPVEYISVVLIIISVLTVLLNIAIFIVSRYVYTSCRNAIILNTRDASPGWIYGRGDCGHMKGPTLIEIMGKEEAVPEVIEEEDEFAIIDHTTDINEKVSSKTRTVELFEPKSKKRDSKSTTPERSDEDPIPSEEESQLLL